MNIGDKLPEVLGIDQNGQEVRTSEYAGRKVILYFYPKDQTPGCTAEACSLRDHYSDLTQLGYEVIGVSADSVESHQKFIEAHQLPFRLIADTEKTLINAMGVWGEKNRYGKITIGLLRTTFLIDEEGKVESIFTPGQIRTKEHAEQIIKRVNGQLHLCVVHKLVNKISNLCHECEYYFYKNGQAVGEKSSFECDFAVWS